MKHLNIKQNSEEWYEERKSLIFTASEFSSVITAKTGKKSTAIDKLIITKLTQDLLNKDKSFQGNYATERGQELEPDAIDCYSITKDVEVNNGGLFIADDLFYGASPDGIIGDNGLLEIKSVFDEAHVSNMLNNRAYIDYYPQLQGQLLCSGRRWVDWMSYHPELPPVITRVYRDEEYIDKLQKYLREGIELYKSKQDKLFEMGYL